MKTFDRVLLVVILVGIGVLVGLFVPRGIVYIVKHRPRMVEALQVRL